MPTENGDGESDESEDTVTQTQAQSIAVQIDSKAFHSGYVAGMTGVGENCGRYNIACPPSEAGIVDIIRNLCEIAQEGWLSEKQLRHDTGLIAGWLNWKQDTQPE